MTAWRSPALWLPIAGALLAAWGAAATFGVTRGVLVALAVALALLALTALRRAQVARGGDGPGIVTVDERRIVYWSAEGGGVVDGDALVAIDLDGTGDPPAWVLRDDLGQRLRVPVTALGADALLDLFTALPGYAPRAPDGTHRLLWRRPEARIR